LLSTAIRSRRISCATPIRPPFEKIRDKDGVHRAGCLPQAPHAAHPFEERRGETPIAEQMIVQKVEMPPRQTVDLRKRRVHRLCVERAAAFEEGFLVTEVADVRTAARDDDRVRHQIEPPLDQIAADGRNLCQRTGLRAIDAVRTTSPKVREESRPRIFAWPQKDGVRVRCRLVGQRRDVQTAHDDVCAAPPIVIGDGVRAVCRRDVDLDDHEIRRILEIQPLDMFILYFSLVSLVEVCGKCCETERRKQ
jgi:hypothetical protein